MPKQIKIVGTGWCRSAEEYLSSEQGRQDNPGFVVERDGTIRGGGGENNVVAVMNAGPVVLENLQWWPAHLGADGEFVPIPGAEAVRVPYEYCSCKPYHGCQHYEMIGDKQLDALRRLLRSLLSQFGISFPYDNQLGLVCPRALAGKSGIYFASSYDKRRSDIHPQTELVNLIKSLAS